MFKGRKLLIATKHQKEKVLAPILEDKLGVSCFINPDFDTDSLGTFTGEVERELDPIATARKKCLTAMKISGCDLGAASEGSFGPHPTLFFVPADDEFLIFIDLKNNLEIIAREISTETNFNGTEIGSLNDLMEFADLVKFPSHGIILRSHKTDTNSIAKGITTVTQLTEVYKNLSNQFGRIYAETDMRALYNPSRMAVIKNAAKKLVDKIKSTCPKCETPGFSVSEIKKGLPCELCNSPTNSTLSFNYHCMGCNFEVEKLYPNGKSSEDPMYCDRCNP